MDKLLHFICGYAITLSIGIWLPWLGALSGVLAAFGKEFIWDKWLGKGTFDWQDINVTLVGVLFGFIMSFVNFNI